VLTISKRQRDAMIATCVRALPDEGCGLLVGSNDGVVDEVVPSENVAHSAKLYEIDSKLLLRTFRQAEDNGKEVIGVFHSHTHSDAYPSPTDVVQAPDPAWHYLLLSLRLVPTVLRSYAIVDGVINEEEVVVEEA
jgi:proteasome lid subunit RPN8/RPN11